MKYGIYFFPVQIYHYSLIFSFQISFFSRPLAPMALLLYAYLIAGFLITLGSLLAYLSVFWQSGATISVDLLDSTQFWWNNAQNVI